MSVKYASREAFHVYQEYLALKTHFTNEKYDYHKYHLGIKASFDKFKTRKDTFQFYTLSKKQEWKNIMISNFVNNKNSWIGSMLDEEGMQVYKEWKSKTESLSYIFQMELSKLDWVYKNNFTVKGGQHPHLLTLFLRKEISIETFTIISHISNIFDYWNDKVLDKFVACDIFTTSKKYKPFLDYDEKKFRKILKDHFF